MCDVFDKVHEVLEKMPSNRRSACTLHSFEEFSYFLNSSYLYPLGQKSKCLPLISSKMYGMYKTDESEHVNFLKNVLCTVLRNIHTLKDLL